jgi:hypothetical protein
MDSIGDGVGRCKKGRGDIVYMLEVGGTCHMLFFLFSLLCTPFAGSKNGVGGLNIREETAVGLYIPTCTLGLYLENRRAWRQLGFREREYWISIKTLV